MYMTTLTALIAMLAIFAVMVSRPDARGSAASPVQPCQITQCRDQRPAPAAESLPRLSRNRWERKDIARMLMTDDDYTGRITPPSPRAKPTGTD
jgi:hypothetical protein